MLRYFYLYVCLSNCFKRYTKRSSFEAFKNCDEANHLKIFPASKRYTVQYIDISPINILHPPPPLPIINCFPSYMVKLNYCNNTMSTIIY